MGPKLAGGSQRERMDEDGSQRMIEAYERCSGG